MINLCNIINVFTATFDQFNASLMNKRITFFQKKEKTSPQIFKCLEQNEEQRMCISAWLMFYQCILSFLYFHREWCEM